MRQILLPTLLLFLGLAACADHGSIAIVADGPEAPINEPDTHIVDPGNAGSTANQGVNPGNGGQGSNTGGGTGGATTGGSNGGGEPGGGGGGEPGGGSGGGGGAGASPVPEPGTLLLVGTGLAGLAGASLRRRQRKAKAA